jgi:hypothetical protein
VWLSFYDTSGQVEFYDKEKDEYTIMVMYSGRIQPWIMCIQEGKLKLKEVIQPL